jgi:hypothetical protein
MTSEHTSTNRNRDRELKSWEILKDHKNYFVTRKTYRTKGCGSGLKILDAMEDQRELIWKYF